MKKKYRIILIVILIINILVSLGFILYYYNKKNNIIDYNVMYSTSKTYELSNMIIPENRFDFEKLYTNKATCDKVYKSIYNITTYMPKLYNRIKDLNEQQLTEFYKDNSKSINSRFTIDTEEKFDYIVKQCKGIYKDGNNEYKDVRFLLDTFNKGDDIINCNLEIEYSNSVVIKYTVYIYNIRTENIVILFNPIVDEKSPIIYGS